MSDVDSVYAVPSVQPQVMFTAQSCPSKRRVSKETMPNGDRERTEKEMKRKGKREEKLNGGRKRNRREKEKKKEKEFKHF